MKLFCVFLYIGFIFFPQTVPNDVEKTQDQITIGLYQRGLALATKNRYEKAISYLNEAINQDSEFAEAWLQLGYCNYKIGDGQQAVEAIKKAIQIRPNLDRAYHYLGDAYSNLGQFTEAIEAYKEAIRQKPDDSKAYCDVGWAYLAVGNRKEATKQILFLQVINDMSGYSDDYQRYKTLLQFVNKPGHKHLPLDEASQDSSFLAFRKSLLQAVRKHDIKFILSILASDISVSTAGDVGVKEFKELWKIYKPDSQLWSTLNVILSMGGAWERGIRKEKTFNAPYIRHNFPYGLSEGVLDGNYYSVVIGNKIALRTRPDAAAPIITTLDYDVVMTDYESSIFKSLQPNVDTTNGFSSITLSWAKVITATGKVGFISNQNIHSILDCVAEFEKIKGKWRMTALK